MEPSVVVPGHKVAEHHCRRETTMRFAGKVAIVTAAAGAGIGQATARAFAAEGAAVVVADHHAGRTARAAEDITSSLGAKALGIACDVTDRGQVERMVQQTLDELGRIDILVNNAGYDSFQPLLDMTDETWDQIMDVNVKGTFLCCQAALPAMMRQKWGRIINLSSVAGMMHTAPDSAAYSASKAAIMGLTRVLAREVGGHGITVNAVAPGFILNPYFERMTTPELLEEYRQKMVVGRLGNPQDIANAILFLAAEEADYVTGSTLTVSGGWHMY